MAALGHHSAGFNETNALSEKLPLTTAMIQHSVSYPGISFGRTLLQTLFNANPKKIDGSILL